MTTGTNYWKIGLFVIAGGAVLLALLLVVGASEWRKETTTYTTLFDESVQGLEVGAPVKYRGVTVGSVAGVDVAVDHRLVRVDMAVEREVADRLLPRERATDSLRAQLAQLGLTGHRFVLLDFFEGLEPDERVTSDDGERFIASVPSSLARIEKKVVETSEHLPQITQQVNDTLAQLQATLTTVDDAKIPHNLANSLTLAQQTMTTINQQLQAANIPGTTEELRATLSALTRTISHVDQAVSRITARDGVLSSAEGSLASVRQVAHGVHGITPQLGDTLAEVQATARSFRRLAETLEREPDMLLKGRRVARP